MIQSFSSLSTDILQSCCILMMKSYQIKVGKKGKRWYSFLGRILKGQMSGSDSIREFFLCYIFLFFLQKEGVGFLFSVLELCSGCEGHTPSISCMNGIGISQIVLFSWVVLHFIFMHSFVFHFKEVNIM